MKLINKIAPFLIGFFIITCAYTENSTSSPPCCAVKTQNEPGNGQKFQGLVIDPALADDLLFSKKNILHFALIQETSKDGKIEGNQVLARQKERLSQAYGGSFNTDTSDFCKQSCSGALGILN